MKSSRTAVAAIIAAQCLVILSFAAIREYRIHFWEPVRLAVEPVDPVSLFRGRYVDLHYGWSFAAEAGKWEAFDLLYLRLVPGEDGIWKLVGYEETLEPRPGSVVLRGRVQQVILDRPQLAASSSAGRIETGNERVMVEVPSIQSYFLSERQAPIVERPGSMYPLTVAIVVSDSGDSQIQQLFVGNIPAEDFKSGGI